MIDRLLSHRGAASIGCVLLILAFFHPESVSAHVIVWPTHSAPGAYEYYHVEVPAESAVVPSTTLHLVIPNGVTVDSIAEPPPGWTLQSQHHGGRIVAIDLSGGQIAPGRFIDFAFAARNPDSGAAIDWASVQGYADGRQVLWNGPAGSAQPASITQLSTTTDSVLPLAASSTVSSGSELLIVATAGLGFICGVTALGVVVLALRHRLL